ncbi:glycosyltransferase family 2 protein [Hymenobacter weizhouensis]|uniref:glycosyltransferase family 2 protein n=1 Tax=Hymenobacter sp. YIM 151500-1 TaxID=2987689 RepID=UPI002225F3AF|nr:glycosyltransferase [Hymenobacter sp. YIM 151500-1]UYZ65115.1 glycosyltransferase [Hymenobacter sp. YIM 151500-1]
MNTLVAAASAAPSVCPAEQPLVSVWLITYNHEPYIAQAIEGVLMQETTFRVELIIGEDCSSDRTREIVQAYQKQYPDRIKLFLSPKNLGMVPVLEPTYRMCTGKYVAMLDGDDYWTDPLKLQKQVELMEADATCHVSFHGVQLYHETTRQHTQPAAPQLGTARHILNLHEIIYLGNPIYTVSAIFRRPVQELPAYYYELPYPDLAIYYWVLAGGGKARYWPEVMGVYRVHAKGAFSGASWYQKRQDSLAFFDIIRHHLPAHYYQQVEAERQVVLYDLLMETVKQKNIKAALHYFRLVDWPQLPAPLPTFSRAHRYGAAGLRMLAKLLSQRHTSRS